jgi:PKD repeat protein
MIVIPGDHPIFVYFEPVYSTVMTYEPVVFDISASGGDSPISFTWFFGDGSSSHLYNPTHSYMQPGTYTIDLYVVDADGDIGHCSHDIIVVQRSEIPG